MSMNSGLIANNNPETNHMRRVATQGAAAQGQAPFAAVLQEQGLAASLTGAGAMPSASSPQLSSILAEQLAGPDGLGKNGVSKDSKDMAARANIVAQADFDKQRMQALEQMGQQLSSGGSLMDMARNDSTMRNLRTVIGSFSPGAANVPMAGSIKAHALAHAHRNGGLTMPPKVEPKETPPNTSGGIGSLASQFESGSAGISAIGYDRVGGTSYGKYQIASRVGSMDNFLNFLDSVAPDLAKQLRDSGPANTGSRNGDMPDTWRKIAEQEPERFEALQEQFIYDSHYAPALKAITNKTSIEENHISSVMQEVLWSTAVQHGPTGAARIFGRAMDAIEGTGDANNAPGGKNFDKTLINNVYAIRAEQFGSSTEAVQDSVRNRMHKEKSIALNMLSSGDNLA